MLKSCVMYFHSFSNAILRFCMCWIFWMSLAEVKQLLEQATSQDPHAIKSAEASLSKCSENYQIVCSLAQIYAELTLAPQIRLGTHESQYQINNIFRAVCNFVKLALYRVLMIFLLDCHYWERFLEKNEYVLYWTNKNNKNSIRSSLLPQILFCFCSKFIRKLLIQFISRLNKRLESFQS